MRHIVVLGIILLWSTGWRAIEASTTKEDYYRLYDQLFAGANYKKEIRPAESLNDPLFVYMTFSMLSIVEVSEKQQMLVTSARLEMQWDDDYLSWNQTEFNGITEILVPQKNVYLPDVVLGNSVSAQKMLGYDQLPIRLLDSGIIDWEPNLLLSTDCDIDITYFPFETQLCKIEFETAVSKASEIDIDIQQGTSAVMLDDFTKNGQWELLETKAENLSNERGKTKIRFSVLIKRRRTFYILNIILPVFFLSLTASLVFALPADEGEKMGTGITVLLAFAVYLTIVSDLVPNTSLQVSILGLYLTLLLGMSAVSVIICVFVLRVHFRDPDRPVGPRVTRFIQLSRYLLRLREGPKLSINQVDPSTRHGSAAGGEKEVDISMEPRLSIHPSDLGEAEKKKNRPGSMQSRNDTAEPMTWQTVAHTLDLICFIFFSLFTILTTVVSLLYLHFGSILDAPSL